MRYILNKGNHSAYCLQFHYVACIKYRRKVLTDKISDRLKTINIDIAKTFGIDIIEQETALESFLFSCNNRAGNT